MAKHLTLLFSCLFYIFTATPASAETPEPPPPGPVYIVQEGDTLWDIAIHFATDITAIVNYNNMPSQDIYVGDRLVIPGLETLSGILSFQPVALGETLRSLSRQNDLDPGLLIELNHIVNPTELYAGYSLILLQQENQALTTGRASLLPGETLLELAARQDSQPWTITQRNGLVHTSVALPYDVLAIPGGTPAAVPMGFPPIVSRLEMDPLPITQGQTAQVRVRLDQTATLGGLLVDHPLNFFQTGTSEWIAFQGVHVMTEPGVYPFRLDVTLPDGRLQSFEQMVLIEDGYFRQDPVLLVEPSTIDPAVTEPENELIYSLVAPVSLDKLWQGTFQLPVADDPLCIRSMYGNRRSYNGSNFIFFHTGVDYGVCSASRPFDIYAPAAGMVIFAGPLTVRGNATIIDHGWGIYSGLWHQEEIYVTYGEHVDAGQLIGKIGATGRVTGPHLHWEIWVDGVQADPIQWLEEEFPHE